MGFFNSLFKHKKHHKALSKGGKKRGGKKKAG